MLFVMEGVLFAMRKHWLPWIELRQQGKEFHPPRKNTVCYGENSVCHGKNADRVG
jgi:hypothetical protein